MKRGKTLFEEEKKPDKHHKGFELKEAKLDTRERSRSAEKLASHKLIEHKKHDEIKEDKTHRDVKPIAQSNDKLHPIKEEHHKKEAEPII